MKIKLENGQLYCWQWETNQRLVIDTLEGYEIENLSCKMGIPKDKIGIVEVEIYKENEIIFLNIPDTLLQHEGLIDVWIQTNLEFSPATLAHWRFRVKKRERPEDYIYTETDVLTWQKLDERIMVLEDIQIATEEYVDAAIGSIEIPECDSVELDTTLTEPGKAADAAATGDAIKNLSDSLSTVATSGDYNDLVNKPEIPNVEDLATTEYVDEKIASIDNSGSSGASSWNDLQDRPFYAGEPVITPLFSGNVDVSGDSSGYASYPDVEGAEALIIEMDKTYHIRVNGEEYILTPFKVSNWGDSFTFIGNETMANDDSYNSGIPLYVYTEVYGEGEHFTGFGFNGGSVYDFEISLYEQYIKKIDPEFVYTPDWDQNDREAGDYIKNRPCFTIKGRTELVFEETFVTENWTFDESGQYYEYYFDLGNFNEAAYDSTGWFGLVADDMYIVDFGGEIYTVRCWLDTYAGVLMSNGGYYDRTTPASELKFKLYDNHYYRQSFRIMGNDTSPSYIKLYHIIPDNVTKLDEKYIPDTIMRKTDVVKPDWNENSERSDAFILNRTHSREIIRYAEVMDETEFELSGVAISQGNGEYYCANVEVLQSSDKPIFTFDQEKIYAVTYDGIEYILEVKLDAYRRLYVGRSAYVVDDGPVTDDKVPFAIKTLNDRRLQIVGVRGSHSIKIQTVDIQFNLLSERYLPPTIARTKDIPTVPNIVTEDWVFTLEDGSTVTKKMAVIGK